MKIWVDDVRQPPQGKNWGWVRTVNNFYSLFELFLGLNMVDKIELISLDHDAGEFAQDGGDYIKILDFLEANKYNIPIHLHTMNPVGRDNMRRIIQKNNWKEVFDIENY